jgi:hypothetical protein
MMVMQIFCGLAAHQGIATDRSFKKAFLEIARGKSAQSIKAALPTLCSNRITCSLIITPHRFSSSHASKGKEPEPSRTMNASPPRVDRHPSWDI